MLTLTLARIGLLAKNHKQFVKENSVNHFNAKNKMCNKVKHCVHVNNFVHSSILSISFNINFAVVSFWIIFQWDSQCMNITGALRFYSQACMCPQLSTVHMQKQPFADALQNRCFPVNFAKL